MEAHQVVGIAEEEVKKEMVEVMIEIGLHINSKIKIVDMTNIMIASLLAEAIWVDVSKRLIRRKETITTDLYIIIF
jgi:hypothetical protein